MNENHDTNKTKNCLNSISFIVIGVFIITFESISLIMSILCIVMTSWNFLKHFIKILNIFSLIIISLLILINILIFVNIKNIKIDIVKNYEKRMCLSILLILIYIIIIIFNIYNSIYLSIKLHIADYPEYGGRKRDQNYIDTHPDEFGDVPLKQFIIVGFCPSIISVLNLMCIILSIFFRQKMVLTYDKIILEDGNIIHRINSHKSRSRHTSRNRSNRSSRNRSIRSNRSSRRYSSEIRNENTNDKIIKNNNNDTNTERNNKDFNDDNNNFIDIKINNENVDEKNIKNNLNKLSMNNRLDTKETLNEEQKEEKINEQKEDKINEQKEEKTNEQKVEKANEKKDAKIKEQKDSKIKEQKEDKTIDQKEDKTIVQKEDKINDPKLNPSNLKLGKESNNFSNKDE